MIEVCGLSAGYRQRPVLQNVNLAFLPGKVTVLLGPNGCGKSTLIKTAIGLLPSISGSILYDKIPISTMSSAQIARKATYLPQSRSVPAILARRMVLHGRFAYLSFPRRYRKEDFAAVEDALKWADALDIADRPMPELSGGQRQKIYLAMALAQQTQTIFMDEPTTYLDVRHQLEVMQVARRLAKEGRAVVLVSHELCLAMRTADRVAVLFGQKLQQTGTPDEVFSSGILDLAFGIRFCRTKTESGWQYYCLPAKQGKE